jgi:hypothetical protein
MCNMLSYKEFYIWLEGYLYGKLENKHIDILPIVEKMGNVKDENEFDLDKFRHLGNKRNSGLQPVVVPSIKQDDDLGHPPRIVM